MSNSVGQPRYIKSLPDLVAKIDKYFKGCEGTPLLDSKGEPVINKFGKVVLLGYEPLTIMGLALALGFNSRTTLLNYSAIPEYMNTIADAKARVQKFAEVSLYDRETVQGSKFNLSNNFGWSEKQEINSTVKETKTLDLSKFTVDQLKEMAKSDK